MATRYEYYNTGHNVGLQIRGDWWVCQTFTPSIAHTITSVELMLYRLEGDSPGTVTVSIRATDVNGHPTGSDLASGTTDGDALPTSSGTWEEIAITTLIPYVLAVDTKYVIVVRALSGDADNLVVWRGVETGIYTGGKSYRSTDGGVTWADPYADIDLMFEEWGTVASELTGRLTVKETQLRYIDKYGTERYFEGSLVV